MTDIQEVTAKIQGINLSVDFDPDVPVKLFSDCKRIKQILFNLLGNALKFTVEGHVKVKVHKESDQFIAFEV